MLMKNIVNLFNYNKLRFGRGAVFGLAFLMGAAYLTAFSGNAHAARVESVTIKILAVNPSDTKLNTVVTHMLPPEVYPEHILERSGMELKYDPNAVTYYLTTSVVLEGKETRTINVKVRNVWILDAEYVEKVRLQLNQTVLALEGTRYHETAAKLLEKAMTQIERIEEEQNKEVTINQQIELYRSHMKQLKQIESGILSMSKLRQLADQAETGVRTVKFIVRAENPSEEQRTMTVRAELPKEITSFDVLNRLDFRLLFDEDRGRFVIEKEDIFKPGEEKRYEIILRDVWYITKDEIDFIRDQAQKLLERFKGSSYETFAKQTVEFIHRLLDQVWELQSEVQDTEAIEDRIRAFVVNHQRMELSKKKIKELQDLLLELPVRQLTEVDQIKNALQELSKVFDIVSLGFTPDLSTTWWLILGIIGFLFIFSSSFYVTWLAQLGKSKFGKQAGKKKKAAAAAPEAAPKAETS